MGEEAAVLFNNKNPILRIWGKKTSQTSFVGLAIRRGWGGGEGVRRAACAWMVTGR